MTIEEVREAVQNGQYYAKYAAVPPIIQKGFIFDEEKSVRWNREQAEKAREVRKEALMAKRQAEQAANRKFEEDLVAAIQEDYHLTHEQACRVYNKAYEFGHSAGFDEVIFYVVELGGLIVDTLSAK